MLKILSIRKFCNIINKNANKIIKTNVTKNKMKYLNVAEKNDAAKTIAGHLSGGTSRRREGLSPYNKIYEFHTNVRGQSCDMVMTSVSGHLLNYAFVPSFKNWNGCDPVALFDAPVVKTCPPDYLKIKETLQREVRSCQALIIWTDCDREGENIGYEIITVCLAIKPNIPVYRAKFSEITTASVRRALDNLIQPDENVNNAVDVRQELDLRIGAAFTRFQTLRFQKVFPTQIDQKLVSYGSCQIPTLGFVAQRYKEAENFIPQTFWRIKVIHTVQELTVEFIWSRKRLVDKQCCEAFLMVCQANPKATVTNVTNKPKSKWRPLPMDTVELEKLGSRKLKITAKETMTIAEKLYSQGIISYPRTETNIFSKEINLRSLVELQTPHPEWGGFANKVLEWGTNPRKGTKSDQAHPPIHPTKFTTNLSGNEKKVYDLVVRHFLACVSRDATGSETIAYITISDEDFSANGLCIHERNYLDVYPYDRWNAKEIHNYGTGNTFDPTDISMPEGSTTAPQMLTEADLIALMEKHGIGTDATHAEHINTIKERGYIGEIDRGYLVPGTLGMGLVEGYDAINLPLAQPKLRAELEADLKLICEGRRDPKEVLAEQIIKYKEAYSIISQEALKLDESLGVRLNETPRNPPPSYSGQSLFQDVLKCPKCNNCSMTLKKKDNSYFIGCLGFPDCKNVIWFDAGLVKEVKVTDTDCSRCGPGFKKITLVFKQRSTLAALGCSSDTYTCCIVCDRNLRNILSVDDERVRRQNNNNTSTIGSNTTVRGNSNRNIGTPSNIPTNNAIRNMGSTNNSSNTSNTNSNRNNRINNYRSNGFDTDGGGERIAAESDVYSANRNRGWFADENTDNIPNRPLTTSWGNNNSNNPNTSRTSWSSSNSGSNRPTPPIWQSATNTNNSGWPNSNTTNSNRNSDWGTNNGGRNNQNVADENVKCGKCNQDVTKLTVKKEGPNKGRQFYVCKHNGEQCNYFKWADEGPSSNTNQPFNTTTSWGGESSHNNNFTSNQSSNTRSNDYTGSSGSAQRGKRKCGLCRQEGHTKLKCPRRGDLDLMS